MLMWPRIHLHARILNLSHLAHTAKALVLRYFVFSLRARIGRVYLIRARHLVFRFTPPQTQTPTPPSTSVIQLGVLIVLPMLSFFFSPDAPFSLVRQR